MIESKYLDFETHSLPGRKTPICSIRSKRTGVLLGTIKWFSKWRQFVLFPEDGTVFSVDCMQSIQDQASAMMAARHL